jgi:cell division septation protein DedD
VSRSGPRAGVSSLTAWVVTLLLALVIGLTSYQLGREWLGPTLKQIVPGDREAGLPAEPPGSLPPDHAAETDNPPTDAQVEVYPRAPSETEVRAIGQEVRQEQAEADLPPEVLPTPAETEPEPGGTEAYMVVAGSFSSPENAERRVDELLAKGYHPFVEPQEVEGKTRHRVIVGLYGDRDEAEEVSATLAEQKIESIVYSR